MRIPADVAAVVGDLQFGMMVLSLGHPGHGIDEAQRLEPAAERKPCDQESVGHRPVRDGLQQGTQRFAREGSVRAPGSGLERPSGCRRQRGWMAVQHVEVRGMRRARKPKLQRDRALGEGGGSKQGKKATGKRRTELENACVRCFVGGVSGFVFIFL